MTQQVKVREVKRGIGLVIGAGVLALSASTAGTMMLVNSWERITQAPIGHVGAGALMVAGGIVGARAIKWLYDTTYERFRNWQRDAIEVQNARLRAGITILQPNEYGRHGIAFDGRVYRDLDTMAIYEQAITHAINPVLEEQRWQHAQIQAMSRILLPQHYSNHVENITGDTLPATTDDTLTTDAEMQRALPERVTLEDMTAQWGSGNYHHIHFGMMVDPETGQYAPVTGDLQECVHVLAVGGPGWGKSTFLEAMAKQLVCAQDVDLAFVDLGVNTFGRLAPYGLYPIADTPGLVVALFQALAQEMQRRYDLFREYPQVKDLEQFNQVTGQNLRPLVCFVDEAPVLFDADIGATQIATDLVRMGRKVGVDFCMGGTDFQAKTLPTSARGTFGGRFAWHVDEATLSRSLIRSSLAVNLRTKGRALALLPGQILTEMQAPIVTRWDDLPTPRPTITLAPAPVPEQTEPAGLTDEQIDMILELHYQGIKPTAISQQVFGYANRRTVDQVRAVIAEYDENDNDTDDNGLD